MSEEVFSKDVITTNVLPADHPDWIKAKRYGKLLGTCEDGYMYQWDNKVYVAPSMGHLSNLIENLKAELAQLKQRNNKMENALWGIITHSHSWVVDRETAAAVKPIHDAYRQLAQKGLGK